MLSAHALLSVCLSFASLTASSITRRLSNIDSNDKVASDNDWTHCIQDGKPAPPVAKCVQDRSPRTGPAASVDTIRSQQRAQSPSRYTVVEFALDVDPHIELWHSLSIMQREWFCLSTGDWPTAIDWTGAVLHTHLTSALQAANHDLHSPSGTGLDSARVSTSGENESQRPRLYSIDDRDDGLIADTENEIDQYFAHSLAYFYAQNVAALRYQAYDDKLWVVLQWLENLKFVTSHSIYRAKNASSAWFGAQFLTPFAQRAREFYLLAEQGWDKRLCGGGMLWNENLEPYKNAITNQLFVTASIRMYLEHLIRAESVSPHRHTVHQSGSSSAASNVSYLVAAVTAYDWLNKSGMRNAQGLYLDGFHISGWGINGTEGSRRCDVLSSEVYTYNQGVLLSGLRDLWEATNRTRYLDDGHDLVESAIAATGWDLALSTAEQSDTWYRLGRRGVLEEVCDEAGECSRDTNSFKGIYFHHLTAFCQPLPFTARINGTTFAADVGLAARHRDRCRGYGSWVAHNARAALRTRDATGKFGGWWGRFAGMTDGTSRGTSDAGGRDDAVMGRPMRDGHEQIPVAGARDDSDAGTGRDAGHDGMQRTVEVQGGGLAVLRSWAEFLRWDQDEM